MEEKCWCDFALKDHMPFLGKSAIAYPGKAGSPMVYEIKYCFICGKKLEADPEQTPNVQS